MLRIAVIDDEYMVIEGFKVIIRRCGLPCEVVGWAENGRDAVAMLQERRPDIVFTDIRMPGMNGLALIEQMTERFPRMDFVIISGYADFSYAQQALRLGVRDYIEKPVTIEKVKEVLARLLAERESAKQEEAAEVAVAEEMHRSVSVAMGYMKEHCRENIGLNDVARAAGMSPAYLSSLFKEETGMSPVKYLTACRMDLAKTLLKEGRKVADVSALLGYRDYRYFIEVFKKSVGKTPNEYRGHAMQKK